MATLPRDKISDQLLNSDLEGGGAGWNGGTYAHYVRATSNAMSGPGAQGSYYSVELQNPTFNGPVYTATLAAYKREGGVITLVGSARVSCKNGMTIRSVMRNGRSLLAYTDNRMAMHLSGLTGLTAGQLGIGAWNTPGGNTVAKVDLGLADKLAPNQPGPSQVSTWVFPNAIDVQMQPPGDDVNGTAVYMYHVNRNGAFLLQMQSSAFTDATVRDDVSVHDLAGGLSRQLGIRDDCEHHERAGRGD